MSLTIFWLLSLSAFQVVFKYTTASAEQPIFCSNIARYTSACRSKLSAFLPKEGKQGNSRNV
jgi:hypothetical protein